MRTGLYRSSVIFSRTVIVCGLLVTGVARAADDTSADFERGFGAEGTISKVDEGIVEEDRFQIGGAFWSETSVSFFDSTALQRTWLRQPNTLKLYGEGKLTEKARVLARGKLVFDPTVPSGGSLSPFGSAQRDRYAADLEELKLQFSLAESVFFTLGKQKIKWGAGKIWNPTDFVNVSARDPLRQTDERSGVTLWKMHIPVGAANFYVIPGFENAERAHQVGLALRAEVAVGPAEFSVSGSFKNGRKPRAGFDFSTGLGNFDLYGEAAYSAGSDSLFYEATDPLTTGTLFRTYTQESQGFFDGVAGVSYEFAVGDDDSASVGLEYYRNGEGYTATANYPWVLANGAYTPYRLSRDYASVYFSLIAPGSWNDWTFQLYHMTNMSDASHLERFNVYWQLRKDFQVWTALGVHLGKAEGEFKLGGQVADASLGLRVTF